MNPTPTSQALADLLYPNVTKTRDDLEAQYPERNLPEGAMVTRFAPSPTGFVHLGGIYASLISKKLAVQSQGVFYLRIEDTDQKREIEGGRDGIITTMHTFGVSPMEGYVNPGQEKGAYGPYIQSQRKEIYDVFAKWLVAHDFAYPCFCSEEELASIAADQEKRGIKKKGYYGEWAKHRSLSVDEVQQQLAAGQKFVLRIKSPEQGSTFTFTDIIKGKVEFEANTVDMVLIKSNGIPTYHFAHVVDDHLMRTTHVTRGEEWFPSVPLHTQLFRMFEFPTPKYLHFSHIGKKEGESVRKLSKRHDPEAAMDFYAQQGYPADSVIEYLLNLANSTFSDWRRQNPTTAHTQFVLDPRKIGKSIAIFDVMKLNDMSKNVVARMNKDEVYQYALRWAEQYDPDLAKLLSAQKEYTLAVLNIEREQVQPRKDIINWSDVRRSIWYFFDELFAQPEPVYPALPEQVRAEDARKLLEFFAVNYEPLEDKETWSEKCRAISEQLGFARDLKSYKENPNAFKGHVGQLMFALRIALTKNINTPDLYQVMQVMGKERVGVRLERFKKDLQ
jgi:glutamyl-tRNA synthetase